MRGGPSPRVRGKPPHPAPIAGGRRSIPARAGETFPMAASPPVSEVHPRACGGNVRSSGRNRRYRRSIPARAGETNVGRRMHPIRQVHPRACGGNGAGLVGAPSEQGPSPRVRGKRGRSQSGPSRSWSIPARAGETDCEDKCNLSDAVHPRACGGNAGLGFGGLRNVGPSPRVRGKRIRWISRETRGRSIPARAGETRTTNPSLIMERVHPRACGGNLCRTRSGDRRGGPSPRVRGKRCTGDGPQEGRRSIPARAGETAPPSHRTRGRWVHPRACGGNRLRE